MYERGKILITILGISLEKKQGKLKQFILFLKNKMIT